MIHRVSERYYRYTRLSVVGMGAIMILAWVVLFGRNNFLAAEGIPQPSGSPDRFLTLISASWVIQIISVWLFVLLLRNFFDWTYKWLGEEGDNQIVWRSSLVGIFIIFMPIFNRILVYNYAAAPIFKPTRGMLNALFNFTDGWRPDNAAIFLYVLCWIMAIWVSSNVMGLIEVSRMFAFGLISTSIAVGWLAGLGERRFISLLILYTALGIAALAFTQIDNRISRGFHSPGRKLSPFASIQFGGMAIVIIAVSGWLSSILTPAHFRSFLSLFTPLWRLLGIILGWIWIVLEPILEFLFNLLALIIESIMSRINYTGLEGDASGEGTTEIPTFSEIMAESDELRFVLIIFAILIGLFIMWVVLNLTILRRYNSERQVESIETINSESDHLPSVWSQLRSWLDKLRGLRPKSLLEPDSIENMYANISRLAGRRGYERAVSQTPDQYLPDLNQAFPGQEQALQLLTLGYMQTHYGEIDVTASEMKEISSRYKEIVASLSLDPESDEDPK